MTCQALSRNSMAGADWSFSELYSLSEQDHPFLTVAFWFTTHSAANETRFSSCFHRSDFPQLHCALSKTGLFSAFVIKDGYHDAIILCTRSLVFCSFWVLKILSSTFTIKCHPTYAKGQLFSPCWQCSRAPICCQYKYLQNVKNVRPY